jgi:predicted nucleic acid-binding protein
MIVVDASAVLELLLQTPLATDIADRVFDARESVHAPHLLDVEVAQVLRRLVRGRTLGKTRALEALVDLTELAIERHSHEPLLRRIWAMRDALTAYDAAYVALAEALDAPLLTCDRKLSRAHGHGATIELIRT